MRVLENHVLVLGQESDDLQSLRSILSELRCAVAITSSEDDAIHHMVETSPCLVILTGNRYAWSPNVVDRLRHHSRQGSPRSVVMIVALTDFNSPSWLHQDENPGFDGLLVKPITNDILASLVQSARARRTCRVLQPVFQAS